ncbi:MAG: STAS domain-containing protein [Chloroflexota bacterium]
MEITTSQADTNNAVTVHHLNGTFRRNEPLEESVQAAYDAGARLMVIDFKGVDYMSSAGLRAIHYSFTLLRSGESKEESDKVRQGIQDGSYTSPQLKLSNVNDRVMEVFSLTGYDMFLDIFDSLEEALASF